MGILGACVCAMLFLGACEREKVDEAIFRDRVTGPWVQADKYSAEPFWEFTQDGKVLDVFGKEIGFYESAGEIDRIHVKAGNMDFTSAYTVSRKRDNISFTDTRLRPFLKATKDLKDRAMYEVHQPLITANLRRLVLAARDERRRTGRGTLTYADLVGPDKIITELPLYAGEDYTGLVFTGETRIRVVTSYGMEVLEQE